MMPVAHVTTVGAAHQFDRRQRHPARLRLEHAQPAVARGFAQWIEIDIEVAAAIFAADDFAHGNDLHSGAPLGIDLATNQHAWCSAADISWAATRR